MSTLRSSMPVTASPRLTGARSARLAARQSILRSPAEHGRPRAGTVVDEAAEVVGAGEPCAVGDDQPGRGLERVESFGSGPERGRERRGGHELPFPVRGRAWSPGAYRLHGLPASAATWAVPSW